MYKIKAEATVTPTVDDIAEAFCELDADQQAEFFNKIAFIVATKWKYPLAFQLQYVTDSQILNDQGRSVMALIGEYAPKDSSKREEPEKKCECSGFCPTVTGNDGLSYCGKCGLKFEGLG